MKLIDKDALLNWAKETYLCENASMIRKVCYKQLVEHLDTLEVKEVNLPTWEPICSFQYFSDNDIFIEDNCLRWGNMVISLDELKKLSKKS